MSPLGKLSTATALALLLFGSAPVAAAIAGGPAARPEEFRYSWKLRGGLAWIAGLRFPVSGLGSLRTSQQGDRLASELVIKGKNDDDGMYVYRSEIDGGDFKTLMTFHGYEWEGRRRNEQTRFDYGDGLALIRKEREKGPVETKTRALPAGDMRDVLTGIHFLRANAGKFRGSMETKIYSDGGVYPVVFRSLGTQRIRVGGSMMETETFDITAAPGKNAKKWPGGVKVWLSADAQRIPYRIEIRQSIASVQMDLIAR
ncbi:MAG TPA: DUF3108 domain-containing protein [Thermoanaerobaculia bacterium]|nr:DUF3108 domain-containing protein [Thermoanaerobaculia bacterium]